MNQGCNTYMNQPTNQTNERVRSRPDPNNMLHLLLPVAAALRFDPRIAAPQLAATAMAAGLLAAAAAPEAAVALDGPAQDLIQRLGSGGVTVQYDGPYMVRETGSLRYPVSGLSFDPLLLLIAAATRCGGILPDELPFNLFQKMVMALLPDSWLVMDLADDDFRKNYQDTWYGTNEVATWLPVRMRSRRGGKPPGSSSPAEASSSSSSSSATDRAAQPTEGDVSGQEGP